MYNATEMGLRVKTQPDLAREEIEKVLREVNGDAATGAKRYGVVRRTFDRWLSELGLQETAAEIREKVATKAKE